MFEWFIVPLQVIGLGVVIAYGIALMIKLLLDGIRYFGQHKNA